MNCLTIDPKGGQRFIGSPARIYEHVALRCDYELDGGVEEEMSPRGRAQTGAGIRRGLPSENPRGLYRRPAIDFPRELPKVLPTNIPSECLPDGSQ